jgi:hypothetical protein
LLVFGRWSDISEKIWETRGGEKVIERKEVTLSILFPGYSGYRVEGLGFGKEVTLGILFPGYSGFRV